MSVAATVAKRIMPLFDRVLVQRAVAETKTKGGLLIPETAQKSPLEATVVAAGPGARNANTGETIPMSVAVGDRVLNLSGKLEHDAEYNKSESESWDNESLKNIYDQMDYIP